MRQVVIVDGVEVSSRDLSMHDAIGLAASFDAGHVQVEHTLSGKRLGFYAMRAYGYCGANYNWVE